ncbi:HAUS augmin-like complex subunit 5 isoform X2 [Alligator mississippiensis]|uniref:HAUS augmin-like complex subunit 5 isoform X2 n=1 Tax=Alligator mississippiensis TaxID=8496 RepID=UPI0028774D79|nr:HAUS augmin-like complex subunit 5 isoform X2 [Alligator mississippiensis]
MERGADEALRRWAERDMGLPAGRLPPAAALRRLCSGQGAEIWAYVTQHVRPRRTVKKIKGNLLWYQHLEEAKGQHGVPTRQGEQRQRLTQDIARLRAEQQQLDLQVESAQRQLQAEEEALAIVQEQVWDARRRALLLQAYMARVARQRQHLQDGAAQLGAWLTRLQDIGRKAQEELVLPGPRLDPAIPIPEPEPLRAVRAACQLRADFMKTLLEHGTAGILHSGMNTELLDASYQHWLSTVEDAVSSHPPGHLLSALQHLALEDTRQLQELTHHVDVPGDIQALKFQLHGAHLEDLSASAGALPSVRGLLQEGWGQCEVLWAQQLSLRAQCRRLKEELAVRLAEAHRLLADGSERAILARAALELELRVVRLAGQRDGLLRSCHALEQEAGARRAELQALQGKRQQILDFRLLVDEKQQNIQALIKGTSFIKSQLRKHQAEVRAWSQGRLAGAEEALALECQHLQGGVERELGQFGAIVLPVLLCRHLGSAPASCHQLSLHWLVGAGVGVPRPFLGMCQSLGFPLYKAPEQLLAHAVELRQDVWHLRVQLGAKARALAGLQASHGDEDVQALVRAVREHDQEQENALAPQVRRVVEQCQRCLEHWPQLQAAVDAWWEQPGQFVLPECRRLGLTLPQWLERWTLAASALQRHHQQCAWD